MLWAQPNPFAASAAIKYELSVPGSVRIEVYNVAGQRVRVLPEADQPAGRHEIRWDGMNDRGRTLPAGVYLITIENKGARSMARAVKIQ